MVKRPRRDLRAESDMYRGERERERCRPLCTRVKYALTNISSLYTDACVSTFTRHIQYTHEKKKKGPFLRSNDHAHMFISLPFLKPFCIGDGGEGRTDKKMNISTGIFHRSGMVFFEIPSSARERE